MQAVILLILDHGCQGLKAKIVGAVYTATHGPAAHPTEWLDLLRTAPHHGRTPLGLTEESHFFRKRCGTLFPKVTDIPKTAARKGQMVVILGLGMGSGTLCPASHLLLCLPNSPLTHILALYYLSA